ncbi:DUF3866 family protein [Knoellia locipacati]|uniref:DUF3866 domain-containing protein n=2 Tax=Knoellia locipacati TaxID=882824 RepID=A0A512T2W1_9MICO|nr:DUF3866 family protein [Knoellia locipacati]GEQ14532.1 hypothetical protein KLO01_25790 [Knoellia locipacati]
MQWRDGVVLRQIREWPGAVEYAVSLAPATDPATEVRALAYTAMVGRPEPGDRVVLNASALLKGLGTGGLAFVVALPDRLPADAPDSPGHIVKARYTPQQQMFLAVDEQDSPHHHVLRDAESLDGMPVVVADLHSALPAIIAGVRLARPQARVAYVMTDGGALPLAFSRAVAGLREAGWIAATITVGQAFGGDHEAVSLHSGLLAARHVVDADVTVVVQGPGNVGTGTPWGYSGVAAAEALHAAHVLGGTSIAALRVSGADPRERHRGISHHSTTAYGKALLSPALVPVPAGGGQLAALVRSQAARLAERSRADLEVVEIGTDGVLEALRHTPVKLSTMGRGLDEDLAGFVVSAVAGVCAAQRVEPVSAR